MRTLLALKLWVLEVAVHLFLHSHLISHTTPALTQYSNSMQAIAFHPPRPSVTDIPTNCPHPSPLAPPRHPISPYIPPTSTPTYDETCQQIRVKLGDPSGTFGLSWLMPSVGLFDRSLRTLPPTPLFVFLHTSMPWTCILLQKDTWSGRVVWSGAHRTMI